MHGNCTKTELVRYGALSIANNMCMLFSNHFIACACMLHTLHIGTGELRECYVSLKLHWATAAVA